MGLKPLPYEARQEDHEFRFSPKHSKSEVIRTAYNGESLCQKDKMAQLVKCYT